MSLLLKEDLDSSLEEELLSSDETESQELKEAITNFTNEACTRLKGEAWDKCFQQLESQAELLDLRHDAASNIKELISGARGQMSAFMGEYDELDSGNVGELKKILNTIQGEINNLEFNYNNYCNSTEVIEGDENVQYMESRIVNFKAMYENMKKQCDKLEDLDSTDESVYSKIVGSDTFSNFKNQVR